MAEQEACASAVTEALAAAGTQPGDADADDQRGESLLLPLLQGLLGGGGPKLLAGLGAAGADVVNDVRRSLARLRAALAPPAQHPQATALLALAERLEDALKAADRLDGCKPRSRRRSRANRHTVGVSRTELDKARRLVDRGQLLPDGDGDEDGDLGADAGSTEASGEPTPERRPSVDKPTKSPQPRSVPAPVNTEPPVERRAPAPKRPDFFRHSVGDAQPPAPVSQGLPRMDRRPSEKSGIAALADKFNAQMQKENIPPPRRVNTRTPPNVTPAHREQRRAPLYKPLPPTYNFAAPPPAEEPSKSRFSNNNKRNRMKRANTIDIGRPRAGYRDSDTDDDGPSRAPVVPPFQPQTENDHKFVAFMQRNGDQQVNGHTNWSNRFGNIKNAFESREREDRSRSSSATRPVWAAPRRADPPPEVRPPWAERRPPPRAPPSYPPVPQSPTKPVVVKPFAAKPIPVNQFSHAPMSAFKPPQKIVSPTTVNTNTPHVWSPPSVSSASPTKDRSPQWPRRQGLTARFEGDPMPPRGAPTSPHPYPIRTIPSQHELAAPELVKQIDSRPKYEPPSPTRQLHNYNQSYRQPQTYEQAQQMYQPPQPTYQPPQQTYQPPQQPYQPPQQPYQLPKQPYQPQQPRRSPQQPYQPPQTYRPPPQTYEPPRPTYQRKVESPKIDAQKLQIEFYEKQVRAKARNEPEQKPPAPYTVTDFTPANMVSTFVPLHQTPDIEKARAHKVDYLPDVVLNEAPVNGHADHEETTEHDSVQTRVMRGPVRGVATTTAGVRTRHEPGPAPAPAPAPRQPAAASLRGVLDKLTPPRRAQVPSPAPGKSTPPSPAAPRSPLAPASPAQSNASKSQTSSPLSKSGSWQHLAPPPPAPRPASPRRLVSRAKSMHLLAGPKLFEGSLPREELGEKKRTVEAYFSGQARRTSVSSSTATSSSSRKQRQSGGFALGRSRTMPSVSELQFLDESNADDAFEDLVSGLA